MAGMSATWPQERSASSTPTPTSPSLLDDDELERARHEALTRVQKLSPGDWDVAGALEPDVHHRGFLIVDGLLSREVDVLGRRCVELIGPGDVMRPWSWDEEGSHVQAEVGWHVLEPTRLAVLDHGLVARIKPWPQLGVELFNRGTRRAHHLAVALAIAHHHARRGPAAAHALASRRTLGTRRRPTDRGAAPLDHQRLADIVGAHRPSVTTAMGGLADAGLVSRRDGGDWVLHGEPPEKLRGHRLAAASA